MGMSNAGHKMSKLMQNLLPAAYRDGEQEGEEAGSSGADSPTLSEHSEHSEVGEAVALVAKQRRPFHLLCHHLHPHRRRHPLPLLPIL
eukprot:1219033-Pleurochrysis_carterae.AAC.3